MKKMIVDGNEACSYTSYMFTETAGIYPITPSSPMAEHLESWSKDRLNIFGDKVKVIEMQSEAGASGLVHGLLKSGCLTSTYTASQGLLLMIPNMYKIAGEMLPCVMHVAARSLATHALSILGDHQDIYAARSTGFCFLASTSVEDCAYLSSVAHLASIKSSLPFLHFFDGFRTSHEINKIECLEMNDYKDIIDYEAIKKYRKKSLNPLNPKIYGTNQNDDIYFQATEIRNKYYLEVPDIVNYYMECINKKANKDYKPFNYYGSNKAKKVIVAMGSVCDTIKETIDNLDEELGLIEVHLYRPFSPKYLLNVLPSSVENIAVLDRTKEFGSREPLYLDVIEALKNKNINIVGGRYGLSGKNTTPSLIKSVYDMLDNPVDNFTIGITDDVTNLSLKPSNLKIKNSYEILIYGYGSDGMVSASKSLIKMIGNNSDKYVQGYFQYDSKKSGGVTKCHLRFSDNKIRSTYYIENPDIVVVTNDTYLNKFEILDNINENGLFLLNTNSENIVDYLNDDVKSIIVKKNIKFYTINANELASKLGLNNKISTILESAILYLTNVIDYEESILRLKEEIKKRFSLKGTDVVNMNIDAVTSALNYLKEVKITGDYNKEIHEKCVDVYLSMRKRIGDNLPVSAFSNMPDGAFECGTSKLDKRGISDIVPSWINSNCIKCGMCSFVCPHGVIRQFKLNDKEYNEAPDFIKERCIDKFIIGISVKDCTGCGLCIKSCISKDKALISTKLDTKEQEVYDYLVNNVSVKDINLNILKEIEFKEPKIQFNGACAGCGQPAYIKLLTQLFGESMMIANATGCSSIYGASAPSMPYTIPWANSLFEDNAEFGFGMVIADKYYKDKIVNIMKEYKEFDEYINNIRDYKITKKYYDTIDYDKYPKLKELKDYIIARKIWTIGGDGWAYDIGFSGIDHVMSNNYNSKILVLDTQVYSNTGGQASKATEVGGIALFTSDGKTTDKKDLARMMMSYNAYVAQVSLANPAHLIKTLIEANNFDGPALIIAYAPCISHGIKGGMINSIEMNKEAVECGYFPLFRYDSNKFYLDSKADFGKYDEFLNKQTRYNALSKVNDNFKELLKVNKENAIKRYNYYEELSNKD